MHKYMQVECVMHSYELKANTLQMAFLSSIKDFRKKKKKLKTTTTRVTTTSGRVKTERRDVSTGAVLEVETGSVT